MRSKFRIEQMRIFISRVFMSLVIFLLLFSESGWDEKEPLIAAFLFFAGAFLLAIASVGRLWCSLYIAGKKTVILVTQGPYALCRNPLYFFSFLGCIGAGLATETFLFFIILMIAFGMYYPFVIKKEELRLEEIHGEAYREYKRKTSLFFPRFSNQQEPEEYVVNPIIFKAHILSALWFVWILGILELIETLHEIGALPALFKFY